VRALGRLIPVTLQLTVTAIALLAFNQYLERTRQPTVRLQVSEAERRAGLRFGSEVPPAVRAWVTDAVARARPEARRLVDEVDGVVDVHVHSGDALGYVRDDGVADRLTLSLDADELAMGYDDASRHQVVLHELGHVVHRVLLPDTLVEVLDAGVPRAGACRAGPDTGDCAQTGERVADTFAKWALGDPGTTMAVGYDVPAPPNLDIWGAPLSALAGRLPPA